MSASAHHNSTPDWQFRITDRDGGVLHGAAVLVTHDHVLTCAHVVRAATGEGGPGARVRLDAPGHGTWYTRAEVVEGGWWWEQASPWDAALLRLDAPAPAVPAPIGAHDPRGLHGHTVRVLGFPHAPAGRWLTGTVRGPGGARPEYVQVDVDPEAPVTVTRGFSGSGVRDRDGALLGIVREAGASGRLAWMIPVAAVPGLGSTVPTEPAIPATSARPTGPTGPDPSTGPNHPVHPAASAASAGSVPTGPTAHPGRALSPGHDVRPAPAVPSVPTAPGVPSTPAVSAVPPAPAPYSTPAIDHEHLHALAVAVSDLETVTSREVRALFVSALDPRLRRRIDTGAAPAVFSHDLVLRAHRDYEILGAVLDQLAAWEEASAPMRRVREAAAPLLRGCGDT